MLAPAHRLPSQQLPLPGHDPATPTLLRQPLRLLHAGRARARGDVLARGPLTGHQELRPSRVPPQTSSLAPSPPSSDRLIGDGEFSDEWWLQQSNSAKFASSFPGGGFDLQRSPRLISHPM
ncbi:hypothetical protein BT93_I0382 [Corymbia citriodora subsp. variegata]|nr:hypothetical protein BT93_I0382 [Corymbia citriodora subsp. variegata]